MHLLRSLSFSTAIICLLTLMACDSLETNRIPAYRVQINLANPGMWQKYGVSGYGESRNFIRETRTPSDFQFLETTYTGFGGVMIVMGMNPFGSGEVIPLAYDLACPVECKQNIRVAIDSETLDAVCPVCHSHYDVTMAGGAPLSGPALDGSVKYRLQPYNCYPSNGGYMIAR